MTKSANIAVLGAGIMGLSAAYALGMRGHRITIFDRAGFPAENASHMAGGMLAPYAEIEHMNAEWIAAGLQSIALWHVFAQKYDIGFSQNGSLLVAHAQDDYILERFKNHLPLPAQDYTADQKNIAALEPMLHSRFSYGIFLKEEAHLNPHKTLQALCRVLDNAGAEFAQQSARPQDIEKSYDRIIDCRGMGAENDEPGLRGVKGEIAIVRNPDFRLARPLRLMHPRYPLYIVPREDHVFMIGATVIETQDNAQVSVRSALELLSALYSLHPSFGDAKIMQLQAGIRPSYPDNLPRVTVKKNVIRCNGLFRHGYLLAPLMGECVADYIEGRKHASMPLFDHSKTGDNHEHHDHAERAA